jgi:hypothetical protein
MQDKLLWNRSNKKQIEPMAIGFCDTPHPPETTAGKIARDAHCFKLSGMCLLFPLPLEEFPTSAPSQKARFPEYACC